MLHPACPAVTSLMLSKDYCSPSPGLFSVCVQGIWNFYALLRACPAVTSLVLNKGVHAVHHLVYVLCVRAGYLESYALLRACPAVTSLVLNGGITDPVRICLLVNRKEGNVEKKCRAA